MGKVVGRIASTKDISTYMKKNASIPSICTMCKTLLSSGGSEKADG